MEGDPARRGGFLRALGEVVGASHLLTDDDLRAPYEVDWTGRWHGRCLAVLRPADGDQVAELLGRCAEAEVAVVPQGGNTGLVGGSVPGAASSAEPGADRPTRPTVVLSLRRLDAVGIPDRLDATIEVGAGATLATVQTAAADAGLEVGIDLAARASATVGGMVATNAGGTRVLRHGTMAAQLAGLEAVRGDGDVLTHLRGLAKDSSGYAWPALVAGSEGTLAVVTRVLLRLVHPPARRAAALVALGTIAEALALTEALAGHVGFLEAAEVVEGSVLDLLTASGRLPPPFEPLPPWALLVQCSGAEDPAGELAGALRSAGADEPVLMAESGPALERLWRYRELAPEALASGHPLKVDVSLPVGSMESFVARAPGAAAHAVAGATLHLFGHLRDGNLHCNALLPDDRATEAAHEALEEALVRLAVELGGSVGAEHGVGRAKRRFVSLVRSETELSTFRALKAVFDPAGILNPGVLLPDHR